MNPLRIAAGVVSLLSEMVGREYRRVQLPYWPDGEAPLVDGIADTVWATMPQQSSAESTAPEAGVDVADEVPTPGRAHTPGVGHLPCAHPFGYDHPCARCGHGGGNIHLRSSAIGPLDCSCDEQTDAYLYYPRHHPACISQLPEVTAGLLIAASIGLRDYADSDACEAPVYWRSIASQLDPK